MKYTLLLALCLQAQAMEITDGFLNKVAAIESNERCTAVGDRGASLGRYQIQRSAWVDACRRNGEDWAYNMDNAFNYPMAHQVAKWHFEWLAQTLKRRGVRVNEMTLYMAYNKGVTGASRLGFNTQINDPAMNRARAYLNTCQ
jgi:hypothetical protein